MIRQIIRIDENKCNGCGLCADACHEGAIEIVDGKAKLIRENFCDGLGDCLPNCPTGAISFEQREAQPYDLSAVEESRKNKEDTAKGCLGAEARKIDSEEGKIPASAVPGSVSRLKQWPVQIKLLPVRADFYEDAKILIAADCTAYAYAGMHEDFMKGRVTLIGCPKLDAVDYSEKLTAIISNNNIRSVTIVRMDVPCCGGLQRAAEKALKDSGKFIPWQVVTISRNGKVLE